MNKNTAPEINEEIPETPTIIDDVPSEDPRDAHIRQLEQDMDLLKQENHQLRCARDQARKHVVRLARHLKTVNIVHEKQLNEADEKIEKARAQANQTQPIKWPCILIAGFAILSLLTGLCADRGWMVVLLAEILICLFLCVCSFFGGIVWSRTAERRAHND